MKPKTLEGKNKSLICVRKVNKKIVLNSKIKYENLLKPVFKNNIFSETFNEDINNKLFTKYGGYLKKSSCIKPKIDISTKIISKSNLNIMQNNNLFNYEQKKYSQDDFSKKIVLYRLNEKINGNILQTNDSIPKSFLENINIYPNTRNINKNNLLNTNSIFKSTKSNFVVIV